MSLARAVLVLVAICVGVLAGCGLPGSGPDPEMPHDEAEDRVREAVDDTVAGLGLEAGSTVVDGPESCLDPQGEERFSYSLLFEGLDAGDPRQLVADAKEFWVEAADDWSEEDAEVSGDVAASKVEFDGLSVSVQITGEPDALIVQGMTGCYG